MTRTQFTKVAVTTSASPTHFQLETVAVVAAGPAVLATPYQVGDVLTLVGGTGTAATLTVTGLTAAGGVSAFTGVTYGDYTVAPAGTLTSGTASVSGATGATFAVTTVGMAARLAPVNTRFRFAVFFAAAGNTASVTFGPDVDANVYKLGAGESFPLLPVIIPWPMESADAGDWWVSSTAASQAGTLLYF